MSLSMVVPPRQSSFLLSYTIEGDITQLSPPDNQVIFERLAISNLLRFVRTKGYGGAYLVKLYEDHRHHTNVEETSAQHYLNNRVFLSRNYRLIVAPRKFDVLKTNICPRSEASRANMLVLRTSNFQGATIRPIVPRHKHSIVFIVHH